MKNQMFKTILAIETSCDETAASVGQMTKHGVRILSNVISSSASLQAKYGGVIPEQAAREQLKTIIPVINEALEIAVKNSSVLGVGGWATNTKIVTEHSGPTLRRTVPITPDFIDAIAVTQGPGLIGSLLVGVETVKTLSLVWQKPLIPVNHLIGHFYANWIVGSEYPTPTFPCLGLLVSGGHTDLALMKDHGQFEYLGGTRDDAAGECFDKCARLLGLPYPGGPSLAKAAEKGNPQAYNLPRPMLDSGDWDFSFSGLKTAVANLVESWESARLAEASAKRGVGRPNNNKRLPSPNSELRTNMAASIQEAIVDVLVYKTIKAAEKYQVKDIIIAGGVAANLRLKKIFWDTLAGQKARVTFFPEPIFCTDNAAMIATAALYNPQTIDPLKLQANPSLDLR